MNNYLKHPNLYCAKAVSPEQKLLSLEEAQNLCSSMKNCSAIGVTEYFENKKIELCKNTKIRTNVVRSCVLIKGNLIF